MFQFHLVRLKAKTGLAGSHLRIVSIPFSTIKSRYIQSGGIRKRQFQFHLVRLKEVTVDGTSCLIEGFNSI